ncbi:MAG: hypothetical protein D6B25_02450 [Desulfobulbaceae bacterium]|nr:MAG: hypothetical protein D6B25_02450 [Desulfobulbaceae bacterium]
MEKSLKKVDLALKVGSSSQSYNFTPDALSFEFIFGIDPAGITPFERYLADLQEGEQTTFRVDGAALHSFFGNQVSPLRQIVGLHLVPPELYFQVQLIGCRDTEPREVVQAMARTGGHGCGGGCDCGCS